MPLPQMNGLAVYPQSVVELQGTTYFLARSETGKRLGVIGDVAGFVGERSGDSADAPLLCRLASENAAALRQRLPWLNPQLLGLQKSVGCGDRLGLATPGHLRAVRDAGGFAVMPAQQSMRENARTGRSPRQVVDDAIWGLLQEGWQQPWGADADHLKSIEHIDACVAAGYTFFTIDPGSHVDNEAHTAPAEVLSSRVEALPWDALEDSAADLRRRYLGRRFDVENFALTFDEISLARAAAKYARAIAHTVRLYRHLRAQTEQFELEVSVDETETPTSLEEHYFVASELKRMGVHWVSLAPRYVGRFEKGVDYVGDLEQFERQFARHAAIARALGPYKLSLHSGSDKFSIYPIIARYAGDLVHLKTAGTSYLEALRAIASVDAALFRDVLAYARQRYDEDRATYHVSANLAQVPAPSDLADHELVRVLDQFDGRQVLHVTFGSVLDRYGTRLIATLAQHEEDYYAVLQTHFARHLSAFTSRQTRRSAQA